jgi:uncharacterized membrane protein
MYDLLLFVHVTGAIVWIGGALSMQVLSVRIQRLDGLQSMANVAGHIEWVGQHLYMPAAILVLLSGIGGVLEGGLGFDSVWVLWGLAGIVFSTLVGALYLGPESGRIGVLVAERGPEDGEVRTRLDRVLLVSRIELVVLISVVFAMTTKPGGF